MSSAHYDLPPAYIAYECFGGPADGQVVEVRIGALDVRLFATLTYDDGRAVCRSCHYRLTKWMQPDRTIVDKLAYVGPG